MLAGSISGDSSAGDFAPCSIQARRVATCSAVSGAPSGGIRKAASVSLTRSSNRPCHPLARLSTAGPLSPPRRIKSPVSSRRLAWR